MFRCVRSYDQISLETLNLEHYFYSFKVTPKNFSFFFFFFFLANRELGYMESKTKWSSPTKDFQKKKWYIKYKLSKGNGQKSDIHMYFGQKAKKMVAKISS
jgi:hypothetical protein